MKLAAPSRGFADVDLTGANPQDHESDTRKVEGFAHRDAKLLALQYHPEAAPGRHDSLDLFGEFRARVALDRQPARIALEDHP